MHLLLILAKHGSSPDGLAPWMQALGALLGAALIAWQMRINRNDRSEELRSRVDGIRLEMADGRLVLANLGHDAISNVSAKWVNHGGQQQSKDLSAYLLPGERVPLFDHEPDPEIENYIANSDWALEFSSYGGRWTRTRQTPVVKR